MATTLHNHPKTVAELRQQKEIREREGNPSGTYFVVIALVALLAFVSVYFVVVNARDLSSGSLFGQYSSPLEPVRWSGQGI